MINLKKAMTNNGTGFLKKEEIKFWIAIVVIAVSGAVTFTKLQSEVNGMTDKGVKLRTEYEKSIERIDGRLEKLDQMSEDQAVMKRDIQYIKAQINGM